jgi:osmoprotectant transport system substrate-binding protein
MKNMFRFTHKAIPRIAVAFFLTALLILPAACSREKGEAEEEKGPVVVGSKIDTEGSILGKMILLMLENNGFTVNDKVEFGPTDVVRKAIKSGEIDIYPEYTGNGGFLFSDKVDDPSVWKDPQKGYETVKRLDKEENDIVWLEPAPANNTWAIAVRGDLADEEGLESLEDFADYVNDGGNVRLACSEEFVSRPDSLPAFEQAYGFKLSEEQLVILSGGNTATTEKAAAEGTDGVNFAMAYGTDGALAAFGLKVMEDTKNVQPVYRPAPIIRGEVFSDYPEIADLLNPVFETLDLETLQELNGKKVIEGRVAEEIAGEYLEENGFL